MRILVALNVLCSYPLIFTPCSNSAWLYLEPRVSKRNKVKAFYTMIIIMILGTGEYLTVLLSPQLLAQLVSVKYLVRSILRLKDSNLTTKGLLCFQTI